MADTASSNGLARLRAITFTPVSRVLPFDAKIVPPRAPFAPNDGEGYSMDSPALSSACGDDVPASVPK
jgi:hypothetical protein